MEIVETTAAKSPRKPRKPKLVPGLSVKSAEETPSDQPKPESDANFELVGGTSEVEDQQSNGLATEAQLKIIHDLIEELGESQEAFNEQVVSGRGLESREQISRSDALNFITKLNDRVAEVASGN